MPRIKKHKPFEGPYSWVIAYINTSYIDRVYKDLKKSPEYKDIEVYIPTVKILKKTFKKENYFEEVPLLFNYGFFKIPRKYAVHKRFLDDMKTNINCIFGWVNDPIKVMGKKPNLRSDNKFIWDDAHVPVATASSEEISTLVQSAYKTSVYDSDDINRLSPGMVIRLRGYPFDNVLAEVVEVLPKKHKVRVNIEMFDQIKDVLVSFDNVFFTIYHNNSFDDSVSLASALGIDENMMGHKIIKNHKK